MAERRPHPTSRSSNGTRAKSVSGATGPGRSNAAGAKPKQQRATAQQRTGASTASGAGRPRPQQPRAVRKEYRPALRIPLGNISRRLTVATFAVATLVAGAGIRLIQLQGFDSQSYAAAAAAQVKRVRELPAKRGDILDSHGRPLAHTEAAVNIIADPILIMGDQDKPEEVAAGKERARRIAEILSRRLGEPQEKYLSVLEDLSKQHYAVVQKQVPAAQFRDIATELNEAELFGLSREDNPIRRYPNGTLAGPVVGFMAQKDGQDKVGVAGLEYTLNRQMSGVPGEEVYDAAQYGRIPLAGSVLKPAQDGTTYTLTIDTDVQQMLEMSLVSAMQGTGSKMGFAITMDIKTGEVIALANFPSYDPGNFATAAAEDLGNRAVQTQYEPGSVAKLLTVAAVVNEGKANADTQIVVPPSIMSGDFVIKDAFEHGEINLTARGVIARSSNLGTIELGRQIPREKYFQYMEQFGLGQPSGIELPGEGSGLVNEKMSSFDLDRAYFGQSISVTGIQMAAAVAAIANGGVYNQPTIIKSATDGSGKAIPLQQRTSRRVISQESSAQVLNMMEGMIASTNGFLDTPNFRQGGKTGTAERYNEKCGCYPPGSWTMSFIDVAPIENPRYLTYMVTDEPTIGGVNAGHAVVAPTVRDFMKFLLPYEGVPFSTTALRKDPLTW